MIARADAKGTMGATQRGATGGGAGRLEAQPGARQRGGRRTRGAWRREAAHATRAAADPTRTSCCLRGGCAARAPQATSPTTCAESAGYRKARAAGAAQHARGPRARATRALTTHSLGSNSAPRQWCAVSAARQKPPCSPPSTACGAAERLGESEREWERSGAARVRGAARPSGSRGSSCTRRAPSHSAGAGSSVSSACLASAEPENAIRVSTRRAVGESRAVGAAPSTPAPTRAEECALGAAGAAAAAGADMRDCGAWRLAA